MGSKSADAAMPRAVSSRMIQEKVARWKEVSRDQLVRKRGSLRKR
jgi:hypothetical protein